MLRALIRKEEDGLYEENSAPEIPLRIVARVSEENSWHVCQTELATIFCRGQASASCRLVAVGMGERSAAYDLTPHLRSHEHVHYRPRGTSFAPQR